MKTTALISKIKREEWNKMSKTPQEREGSRWDKNLGENDEKPIALEPDWTPLTRWVEAHGRAQTGNPWLWSPTGHP